MRRDAEADARRLDAGGERFPIAHGEHDAEVRHRNVVAIDRGRRFRSRAFVEMRHDLVSAEIEVDPPLARPPLAAPEHPPVEVPRGGEIVDGKGEVEGAERHGPDVRRTTSSVTPDLFRGPPEGKDRSVGIRTTVDAGTSPA